MAVSDYVGARLSREWETIQREGGLHSRKILSDVKKSNLYSHKSPDHHQQSPGGKPI